MTKKCKVVKESVYSFRITLIQGLNRQIRRMCEYFEYDVVKLERIRIMNIGLKGIPLGEWRQLEPAEIQQIMTAIENSSSTAEPRAKSQDSKPKTSESKSKPAGHRAPAVATTKKPDRASNPNPKSKELRGGGQSSSKRNDSPRGGKSFGNTTSRKSGRR